MLYVLNAGKNTCSIRDFNNCIFKYALTLLTGSHYKKTVFLPIDIIMLLLYFVYNLRAINSSIYFQGSGLKVKPGLISMSLILKPVWHLATANTRDQLI